MIYINITSFVLISKLEKDHSMTETRRLKKVFISIRAILSLYHKEKLYTYLSKQAILQHNQNIVKK